MQFKVIALFLLAGWLTSCETTIEIRIPESERKIVLGGRLCPDSLVVISLGKSLVPTDKVFIIPIEDAAASLYENDQLTGVFEYIGHGFYRLPGFYPSVGKTYRVEASAGEMKPVTATTSIPPPVRPEVIELSSKSGVNTWDDIAIKVRISDPGNEENFYSIGVKSTHFYYDYLTRQITDSLITWQMGINMVDVNDVAGGMNLIDVSAEVHIGGGLLFTDELFNGKEFTLTFDISDWEYSRLDTALLDISFDHISKPYYLFGASFSKASRFDGMPFAEPVSVYSNVENGLGFLGSYTSTNQRLILILKK